MALLQSILILFYIVKIHFDCAISIGIFSICRVILALPNKRPVIKAIKDLRHEGDRGKYLGLRGMITLADMFS